MNAPDTADLILGGADPALAKALIECARQCKVNRGALTTKSADIRAWTVVVFIRAAIDKERASDPSLLYRVMLRISLDECPPLMDGHATLERMIDRFFMVQEHALNALVLPWRGRDAPLSGVLKPNQVSRADEFVGHIDTSNDGKWRCDHWTVTTPH